MLFNEDILQFTWRFGLFNSSEIHTSSGEKIEILSAGILNKDAGPDFENAKIRIEGTLWVGNVEIHLLSSDWNRHHHSSNQQYDNVILHVVYEHDQEVFREDGTKIPVISLKGRVSEQVLSGYEGLMQNMNWIPCGKLLADVDTFLINNWLYRMMLEKLELKFEAIRIVLQEYKGSWEDAFYIMLARNFGFKINAVPFEMLARSIPLRVILKHKASILQIEALIFGQAGLLANKQGDAYQRELNSEYQFLRKKFNLKPIDSFLWKFSRLRPHNFPTLRLAQFAALLFKAENLFTAILNVRTHDDSLNLFTKLPINAYWNNHYRFNKETVGLSPQPGKDSCFNLVENTLVPFLFAYGRFTGNERYTRKAIALVEGLPPETNQVIRQFRESGVYPEHAGASQALVHLKKMYCDKKKCLTCGIGVKLVSKSYDTTNINLF